MHHLVPIPRALLRNGAQLGIDGVDALNAIFRSFPNLFRNVAIFEKLRLRLQLFHDFGTFLVFFSGIVSQ